MLNNIGLLFKQRRQELGLTQEELGKRIGVGRSTISKIESSKGLTFETINRVAKALEIEVEVQLNNRPPVFQDKVDYLMIAISEFARNHNMPRRLAANYLVRFGGIDFIDECYAAEHTLSMADCVRDLTHICQKHGGMLV